MKSKPVRSFIAIPLPTPVQRTLQNWIDQLKREQRSGVRWVNTTNLHLTIKFLGDIDPESIPAIQEIMQRTAASFAAFTFNLQELGAFPGLMKPRVIWAGIQAPPELKALHRQLESNLKELGFPPEDRPFSPHLTLGRLDRRASDSEIAGVSALLKKPFQESVNGVPVETLHLYRSDLKPAGPIYSLLYKAALKKTPPFSN